jgi:peptidoglycan/LPS O-acetylase OafA/YrhL
MNVHYPRLLETKPHFEILDGLRGIAALAIVIFHFMEWVYTDHGDNFIGHGFLAVDFFFCLSGFVTGYAYDDRIKQMGRRTFFISRLIRLHPLVILGAVLGLLAFVFDPFSSNVTHYSIGLIVLLFLSTLFMIPLPVMEERAFNLFGLNAPSWSLFWEYVANLFYAWFLCKLNRRWLTVLIVLAAVWLCTVSYRRGNLLGGWAGENFWDGCARISYSFSAGLLIFRAQWSIKNRLGFLGLTGLLLLAFLMPDVGEDWLAELLVVLLYFPLLVCLGVGTQSGKRLKKWCVLSGRISYPLYMTHYAVIWIFGNYYTRFHRGAETLFWIIPIAIFGLVAFAYLVMVAYDTPVRRYLTVLWKAKRSSQ